MESTYPVGLMWFRRDLRGHDNAALYHALKSCAQVHCVFVFDTRILVPLDRQDRRVGFIRESCVQLDAKLRAWAGSPDAGLIVRHAEGGAEIARLARELNVQAVFANHDDEPAALARDSEVGAALAVDGIAFHTFKDHVIFERAELLTQGGTPYSVFTPYKNAWLRKVDAFYLSAYPVARYTRSLARRPATYMGHTPSLAELGFEQGPRSELALMAGAEGGRRLFEDFIRRMDRYEEARNFPALKGPSYLGVHLRFGTVSIRELASAAHARAAASPGAATWLSELIWRDFFAQVLANFPHVVDAQGNSHSFKRDHDAIEWEQGALAQALFQAWCEGRTGYPLVDAAMAQINQTGYMHNRLRMVVASFLTKSLGLDWRWGERYFARHLNDYELASNNGGWQWASSSGCDAQPYFRIFNPVSQSRKFDPDGRFIRRYVPQLAVLQGQALHAPWTARPEELEAAGLVLGRDYPAPLVDHGEARQRTLARYAAVKGQGSAAA
ncbi:MAG TPA: deoxyribodipyrimidine photo-lyase [Ramlibacter sp.]|nr:deoxyribodipyrimidine photo-lyase [Ramlibacter sp.]